jgi:hypothetical protein
VFSEHIHQNTPSTTLQPMQPISPAEAFKNNDSSSNNKTPVSPSDNPSIGSVNTEIYNTFMNKRETLKAKRESRARIISARRRRL